MADAFAFTWTDLQRLKGELKCAPDSDWWPRALRDNLFATIRFALNPANGGDGFAPSGELSIRDFYHGHVVVRPPGTVPAQIARVYQDFLASYQSGMVGATARAATDDAPPWSPDSFPDGTVTAADRATVRDFDASRRDEFKRVVSQVFDALPADTAVSYHTREKNRGSSLSTEWKFRNLLVDLFPSGSRPVARTDLRGACLDDPKERALGAKDAVLLDGRAPEPAAPQVGIAAEDWPVFLHFAFLVRSDGVVFIRPNGPALIGLDFSQ